MCKREKDTGGNRIDFKHYLSEELEKYNGVAFPVKDGSFHRLITKKADVKSLHPNPEDEFCSPEIGPSYRIISEYEAEYLDAMRRGQYYYSGEPVIVEKMHPDGYMIMNGHHRWAAAVRLGRKDIPVKIVNLTQKEDIKQMLRNSVHERRVTMDLDEVVFCTGEDMEAEAPLPAPWDRVYKEKLRRGIPALFRYLRKNGFDIWVYSSEYYSFDFIQNLFKRYHADVTGVVTGTARKTGLKAADKKKVEEKIASRFLYTVHIDDGMVLKINSRTKDFEDYELTGPRKRWAREVMETIRDNILDK